MDQFDYHIDKVATQAEIGREITILNDHRLKIPIVPNRMEVQGLTQASPTSSTARMGGWIDGVSPNLLP